MPNFSVPNSISPGDALDANKAMANWNQVVTDLNANKIDATNTAASFAKDVVEPAFSGYKEIFSAGGIVAAPTAATLLLSLSGSTAAASPTSSPVAYARHLNLADYTAGSRATFFRVRGMVNCNATAPAVNFTFGLYPVTFSGGAATFTVTTGTVVAGSTAAVNVPGASATTVTTGADFGAPAAGAYALAVVVSGAAAANSDLQLFAALQIRQV